MLRMWEEKSGDYAGGQAGQWRFQMEDPRTGRRHGFNELSALLAFLQGVVSYDEDAGFGPDHSDKYERKDA